MAKIVVIGSCNIDVTVECDRWAKPEAKVLTRLLLLRV